MTFASLREQSRESHPDMQQRGEQLNWLGGRFAELKTSQESESAERLFESISQDLVRNSNTTKAKMFGAPGLRVGKKFFSCLFKDELVLKLPQKRVESLVKSGAGKFFDPGMGRPMKDWISLTPTSKEDWLNLAVESRDYVVSLEKAKK